MVNIEMSQRRSQGRLKIFFSYTSHVGKTRSMLEEAQEMAKMSNDVIVGYIENPKENIELLKGMECLPTQSKMMERKDIDIDAILKRQPHIVLIDNIAHSNVQGARHFKRYQDIQELLNAGIDVYTTANVQDIAGLEDDIFSIVGYHVSENIPDYIFDQAHQVKFIDIEPEELITKQVFYSLDTLIALRELSLRRCAERIRKLTNHQKLVKSGEHEHILVCLSSSPSNAKIIRTAAKMAGAYHARLSALYVSPLHTQLNTLARQQLQKNIRIAKDLGAQIEMIDDNDIAFEIAEYARLSGVSKIILGQSPKRLLKKQTLAEQLMQLVPHLDIYIVPYVEHIVYQKPKTPKQAVQRQDILRTFLILLISTLIGYLFYQLNFKESNIIVVYILGVLITAMTTTKRIYSMISSFISVLIFNFFFTNPQFTFMAYDSGYPVTFIVMFLAAFITSGLTNKLQTSAKASAQNAYRTKTLLETNQMLQKEKNKQGIITVTCQSLSKLLQRDIIFYPVEQERLEEPLVFCREGERPLFQNENEKAVAKWVLKNNKHAGATTQTLSNAMCLYLAVRVNEMVYGVIGIHIEQEALDAYENNIMLSILGELALALENQQTMKEKAAADLKAKNEQLRANLLRSISHDLRTPLTSISGNAGILLRNGQSLDEKKKHELYSDIYDDALWLINLVENLLSVTRIENGTMNLNLKVELMDEVIDEALKHVNRQKKEHQIIVTQDDEILLAKMDARLIVQVIINIVDNAMKYTKQGSTITIHSHLEDESVIVDIADDGDGIKDENKPHIFDMFYTANHEVADSRRSLGLGLALCQSIMKAHHGDIQVYDNVPHGAVFRLILPSQEVMLYE